MDCIRFFEPNAGAVGSCENKTSRPRKSEVQPIWSSLPQLVLPFELPSRVMVGSILGTYSSHLRPLRARLCVRLLTKSMTSASHSPNQSAGAHRGVSLVRRGAKSGHRMGSRRDLAINHYLTARVRASNLPKSQVHMSNGQIHEYNCLSREAKESHPA